MLKLRAIYYITHIDNLPSILDKGILCHKRIEEEKIQFTPIYDAEIVESRKNIKTSDNRNLWDFANLYFQPRNAMLYRVVFFSGKNVDDIIVIGVKSSILARSDIYITTGNAASPYSNILSASEAKKNIDNIRKQTDKEWWAFEDGSKRELMAECLVPDKVSPECIQEIYVATRNAFVKVEKLIGRHEIPVIPEPFIFFLPSRKIDLTGNLSLVEGDMFFSRMQTLTISVNTVGIMGKGLASRAKYQFPDVYVAYQDLCRNKVLKMGKPYLYKRETSLDYILADEPERLSNANLATWFLLFPTKRHWKEMADIKGIEEGLKWLVNNYKKEGIESLSIPALGCGLGWLDWGMVGPLLCNYLQHLDIQVNLYLPVEKKIPDDQLAPDFLLEKNL
ncbi:DarT ssDNA thymidine ADP-ribosyltransferase family protein [candidate division NPL-UPA2 bacterium]|nr:DarT ssDNA thymidine ADP-ribosyltransferase family protein [candidate division NPL-UPA2 bacterium]